jgi:hypothetical protein
MVCPISSTSIVARVLTVRNSDYNPRLAFRDDTDRTRERIQDVTTDGYSVWGNGKISSKHTYARFSDYCR